MNDPVTEPQPSRWLYDHLGRLAGAVLLMLAFAFVAFLAAIGFKPAYGLLVFLVVGMAMIVIGGRLHRL